MPLTYCSIVFVHGLGSNPDTTWQARRLADTPDANSDRYVNWVSEFLPDDLPPITRKDTRLYFYNYDSYWKRDAVQTRLWDLGEKLLEHIKTGIRRSEEVRIEYDAFNSTYVANDLAPGAKPGPDLCRI